MFVNWLWLCLLFPPHQGRNISEDQFDCVSDAMKEFAAVLPEPAEYKDDLPLPNFSHQPTAAQPALRGDQDPLRADDWAKLDSMVGAA